MVLQLDSPPACANSPIFRFVPMLPHNKIKGMPDTIKRSNYHQSNQKHRFTLGQVDLRDFLLICRDFANLGIFKTPSAFKTLPFWKGSGVFKTVPFWKHRGVTYSVFQNTRPFWKWGVLKTPRGVSKRGGAIRDEVHHQITSSQFSSIHQLSTINYQVSAPLAES